VLGTRGVGTVRTGLEVVRLRKARPESTTLHRVVRENLATLYAAVEQGFASPLPAFVKDELEGYVACGVLARGLPSCTERTPSAARRNSSPFCS
jgi:hypothetical protein